MFSQFIIENTEGGLDTTGAAKTELIKRYYAYLSNQDVEYSGLMFQADTLTRMSVITPYYVTALAAISAGQPWQGDIASNTKNNLGEDIVKSFTASEMFEYGNKVLSVVGSLFFQRKNHCNVVAKLTTVQEVIDYDFSPEPAI